MILTQHQLNALALITFGSAILLLTISGQAQEAPKARKVIDRAVIAMGGKEKLKAITSREAYGSIKRLSDGATGKVEFITRQPSSYFYRIAWDKDFKQAGYNGISGYQWKSEERGENISGLDLEIFQLEAAYRNGFWYHDERQRWPFWGKALAFVFTAGLSSMATTDRAIYEGQTQWLGKPAEAASFYLSKSVKVTLYFDQGTGYLIGERFDSGKVIERYEYEDFRPLNGVIEPHFIRLKSDNETFEIQIDRIVFNQPLETARFEMPTEAQPNLPNLIDVIAQARANQEKVIRNYDQLKYAWFHDYDRQDCYKDSSDNDQCQTVRVHDELDVFFYRGYPISTSRYTGPSLASVLFGKDTSPDERKAKSIDAAKRKVDAKIQKKEKKGKLVAPDEGLKEVDWFWGKGVLRILRYAKFSNLRPARYQGKDFYLIDFFPTPGEKNDPEKSIDGIGGTIWIDAQSMFVEKMETRDAERYKENTKQQVYGFSNGILASVKQERFCADLWLPSSGKAGSNESVFRNYTLKDGRPVCDAQNKSLLK